ncbi:hypothetical protein GCM10028809_10410 [Spirosoma gilvum]
MLAGCLAPSTEEIFHNCLGLSSAEFEGIYTQQNGDMAGLQGREATNRTNTLLITDRQGIVLTRSTSQSGEHDTGCPYPV